MIEEGRIALNGEIIAQPAPLLASLDGLTVDGNPVAKPVSTRLYRFHKPAGCLTAARDPKGRKTIYDLLPKGLRSEEHTSELQSLMRISYAVFCLKKKKNNT